MKKTIEQDGQVFDAETGELINEVEQVEVEVIEDSLPSIVCNGGTHIQTNTNQLKKELVIHLAKYDIEVTAETEKEASKQATELNKLAIDLNKKRLAVGKEIKKPADALKKSIDELIDLVQEKRTDIIEKVEVFKQERFEYIRALLKMEVQKLYLDLNVSDKYQVVDIESLVKEGSLGKTSLSKSAKESLNSMVQRVKALEDAVTIRTLQLEVTCKNAGLEFAIELSEIEHIIQEDDYDAQLNNMIENRLSIQEKMKQQAKEQAEAKEAQFKKEAEDKARLLEEQRLKEIEKEKQDKIQKEEFRIAELARVEREKEEAIQKVKDEAIAKENARLAEIERVETERLQKIENERIAKEKTKKETGKKIVTLVATFEIEVNADVDDKKVLSKYEDKIKKDFSTLSSLSIR